MSRLRSFDRWVRWATLLALTLATLAPGVSHALRHVRGETLPWSLVCSATGSKRVLFDAQPADDGSPAHAFEQCTYCALHHDGQAPSVAVVTPAPSADLAHAVPTVPPRAPAPEPAWRLAPSRAPPLQA